MRDRPLTTGDHVLARPVWVDQTAAHSGIWECRPPPVPVFGYLRRIVFYNLDALTHSNSQVKWKKRRSRGSSSTHPIAYRRAPLCRRTTEPPSPPAVSPLQGHMQLGSEALDRQCRRGFCPLGQRTPLTRQASWDSREEDGSES